METAIRRRRRSGKRTGRRRAALTRGERRRLLQLGASLVIFALAFVGRNVFPEGLSRWDQMLRQNTDFKAAFTQFGRAVSQGEPVLDTLGELWVEVFAGGAPGETNPIYAQIPSLTRRCRTTLTQGDDPVMVWCRTVRPVPTQTETDPDPTTTPAEAPAVSAAPTVAETTQGESVALIDVQAAMPMLHSETAVAQTVDDGGNPLPDGVSLKEYALGLNRSMTPVMGSLTSDYGYRDHPVSGDYTFHRGVDIGAADGAPIAAFSGGLVDCVGEDEESGRYLRIDHGGGVKTFYAHCSQVYVSQGDQVELGQIVAAVGETGNATGPHLHFAVIKDGVYLDPMFYIRLD